MSVGREDVVNRSAVYLHTHEHPRLIEIQELNKSGTLSLSFIENSCYHHIDRELVTEAIDNVCLMPLKQNASLLGWLLNA